MRNKKRTNSGMHYDETYNGLKALGEVVSTAKEIGFNVKVVRKSEDDTTLDVQED